MPNSTLSPRTAGIAGCAGGLVMLGLGVATAVRPDIVGPAWFVVTALAIGLLVIAVLGLRTAVAGVRVARIAATAAAAALVLFGLAHLYALVDTDTAILLFSVFMVAAAAGLIVAGVAVVRAGLWSGAHRFVPLLCGVWPVATVPAGSAIGDVPHFLAIAVWGACWAALGLTLLSSTTADDRRAAAL